MHTLAKLTYSIKSIIKEFVSSDSGPMQSISTFCETSGCSLIFVINGGIIMLGNYMQAASMLD